MRVGVFSVHPAAMRAAEDAFVRGWPGARRHHLLDDGLLDDALAATRDHAAASAVLEHHARYLIDAGANALLFTCSAFHHSLSRLADLVPVPLLGPNRAMIDTALSAGGRLAVLATVPTTLTSLTEELRATPGGATAVLQPRLVDGAFQRLLAGDPAGHDRLVLRAAQAIDEADEILLAQFTLARLQPLLQQHLSVPVRAAPQAAVARLRSQLDR